jgi:hypothetical protein
MAGAWQSWIDWIGDQTALGRDHGLSKGREGGFGLLTDSRVFFTLNLAGQARRMTGAPVEGRLKLPRRTRMFGPIRLTLTRQEPIIVMGKIGYSDIVGVTTLRKVQPRFYLTGSVLLSQNP